MSITPPVIDADKTRVAHELLAAHYGPRVWRGRRDPLDELVMTVGNPPQAAAL